MMRTIVIGLLSNFVDWNFVKPEKEEKEKETSLCYTTLHYVQNGFSNQLSSDSDLYQGYILSTA